MIIYRPLKTPKALTFDLDDTLYDNWPIIRNAEVQLHQFLRENHPDIARLAKSEWQTTRQLCIAKDPRLGSDMTRLRKAVLTKLARDSGYTSSAQESVADDGYAVFYRARSSFKINETIYSLLESLSKKCRLVAITNGNVDLQQVGIADLFEISFQASIHHPMKPNASMFQAAIKHLNIPAAEIMHIGDHLIKDVWGAHQQGLQTAWYAINRTMQIQTESARVLPSVILNDLNELSAILV